MNDQQIKLVQTSFEQIAQAADSVSSTFYERLFALDPQLRPLFSDDLGEQKKKLIQALAFVVVNLRDGQKITPALQTLGRRHVAYGVRDRHYATVGQALIQTLEIGLGPQFTVELRHAWSRAYQLVANTMLDAARSDATAVTS